MHDKLSIQKPNIHLRKRLLVSKYVPKKIRIIAGIIVATTLIISLLFAFKPQAKKQDQPETIIKVDIIQAKRSDYPIIVKTSGVVEADTRGNLVSQIGGEIVNVSDQFKTGGAFNKGDTLIQVDNRDYVAEVSRSLASVSQAQANFQQEQANAKQAAQDWQRLGNTQPAPPLVLRKPQLAAAKAQLDSAQAAYQTAKLNLTRTKIKAPYTGRVIRRDTALGQYVGIGTVLAEVFATDVIEVSLPLSQHEYSQLGLEQIDLKSAPLDVILSSDVAGQTNTWHAKLTRTDSVFDTNTRQISAIATVHNPFDKSTQPNLKIGQFVDASIQGRTVNNVFVLPNRSMREGNSVFVVREQRLKKIAVNILWQDDKNALVEEGLSENELIVTTSLNGSVTGTKVKLPENITGQIPASNNISTTTTQTIKPSEPLKTNPTKTKGHQLKPES